MNHCEKYLWTCANSFLGFLVFSQEREAVGMAFWRHALCLHKSNAIILSLDRLCVDG
jgi:hypothetical protein